MHSITRLPVKRMFMNCHLRPMKSWAKGLKDDLTRNITWSTVLLDKPTVVQHVKKSPRFMETVNSLPCSQQTATGFYREPDESSPHPHALFPYGSSSSSSSSFKD
jgi:hypothetical protein